MTAQAISKKNRTNTYVAIMAGGVGSRFWPSSTEDNPKQFLDILGKGKSLLRITFDRFEELVPRENIFIVTHIQYREKIREHLPEVPADNIICEPSRNNTAPGIAYAAFKIRDLNPEAMLIMAPSDHIILKEKEFRELLVKGLDFCRNEEVLLTLGIMPSRPDTGYGYINFDTSNSKEGVYKVREFKEKPDLQTALGYLQSGNYLWNSGMFIWKCSTLLDAFRKYAPGIYEVLSAAPYNTPEEYPFIERFFPGIPGISVDYAIMEKADNIYTLPADIAWSDLGTWNALHAFLVRNDHQNVIFSKKSLVQNSTNNLIKTREDKIVVVKDLNDFIVIDEENVLLIYPKNKEQEIRDVREEINNRFPKEAK